MAFPFQISSMFEQTKHTKHTKSIPRMHILQKIDVVIFFVQDINGASFAGFYYICFQKSSSTVEGYYFHRNSEW